jgi:hypothetical protein
MVSSSGKVIAALESALWGYAILTAARFAREAGVASLIVNAAFYLALFFVVVGLRLACDWLRHR